MTTTAPPEPVRIQTTTTIPLNYTAIRLDSTGKVKQKLEETFQNATAEAINTSTQNVAVTLSAAGNGLSLSNSNRRVLNTDDSINKIHMMAGAETAVTIAITIPADEVQSDQSFDSGGTSAKINVTQALTTLASSELTTTITQNIK